MHTNETKTDEMAAVRDQVARARTSASAALRVKERMESISRIAGMEADLATLYADQAGECLRAGRPEAASHFAKLAMEKHMAAVEASNY